MSVHKNGLPVLRLSGLLAALALVSTACTSTSAADHEGMTAMTTGSSAAPSSAAQMPASGSSSGPMGSTASAEHNDADVMFAQMMIEHHRGAIAMAQLAPDRAASAQVKELAARIEAAQAPEIEQMTGWLEAWGVAMNMTTDASGMSHDMPMGTTADMSGGMPGMMTPEQMAALTAASGAAFDKMFLEMMVVHHQGAIDMAETEIAEGSNPEALSLADSIRTSQTAEITEMQELLAAL